MVASNLSGDDNPIGATIRISRIPFTVVGLLDVKVQTRGGRTRRRRVVPLSTARWKLFGGIPASACGLDDDRELRRARIVREPKARFATSCASLTACSRSRRTTSTANPYDYSSQDASCRRWSLCSAPSPRFAAGGRHRIMNIMLVGRRADARIGLRMAVGRGGGTSRPVPDRGPHAVGDRRRAGSRWAWAGRQTAMNYFAERLPLIVGRRSDHSALVFAEPSASLSAPLPPRQGREPRILSRLPATSKQAARRAPAWLMARRGDGIYQRGGL